MTKLADVAEATAIRPFQVNIPEADLTELRRRVSAAAPRSWAEQAYPNLVHYNRHPRGGHFATWEQPTFLSEDMRAGFRSLRT